MRRPLVPAKLLAAVLSLAAVQAQANSVGLSGFFTRDDQVAVVSFRTVGTGNIHIETFGYAGGTDATGRTVAGGGFDPVFALFRGDGTLLAYGDDGATRFDSTGAALDAVVDIVVGAGNYFVAISQFDNFAIGPNFAAGFLESGNATFTAAYGCGAARFCDINGVARSGSFDLSVDGAEIPEPVSLALVGLALPGLWLSQRRRRAVGDALAQA